jgi:6-pyruvoyltetrahydropterin 2'-reductase
MTKLAVAEQFYSLQGEGLHAGEPAIFLRLAGCNLQCGLSFDESVQDFEKGQDPTAEDASWICDTIDVWREADNTYEPVELVDEWDKLGWFAYLRRGAHIVLTGGEPTLRRHQESFFDFYSELRRRGIEPFVEVETNGTQGLLSSFDTAVDQYNVSLKLANSGQPEDKRLVDEAIEQYVERDDAVFKFVVGASDDIADIAGIVAEYSIPRSQVMLMPAGQTQEQLAETYSLVAEMCKQKGYRFSPRLHVELWNQATGV